MHVLHSKFNFASSVVTHLFIYIYEPQTFYPFVERLKQITIIEMSNTCRFNRCEESRFTENKKAIRTYFIIKIKSHVSRLLICCYNSIPCFCFLSNNLFVIAKKRTCGFHSEIELTLPAETTYRVFSSCLFRSLFTEIRFLHEFEL